MFKKISNSIILQKKEREYIKNNPLIRIDLKIRGSMIMIIFASIILIFSIIINAEGIKIISIIFIVGGILMCFSALREAIKTINIKFNKSYSSEDKK